MFEYHYVEKWYMEESGQFVNTFRDQLQVVQLDEHPGIEEKLCRYK